MSNESLNGDAKVLIGKLIKEQFLQSKISIEDFAGLIGCNKDNVYDIFRREHLNTEQLFRISKILNFDFFSIYSKLINNEMIMQVHITVNIPKREMEKGNICEYCARSKTK